MTLIALFLQNMRRAVLRSLSVIMAGVFPNIGYAMVTTIAMMGAMKTLTTIQTVLVSILNPPFEG